MIREWALLFILLLVTGVANAQDKVVLHINDAHKFSHLKNTVKNFRKESGPALDIKVVVNGKAVTRLLKSNIEHEKIVRDILDQDVTIGLCHNAVSNNKVKKNMLIKGLEILESDGNVTIMEYQKEGYIYIKL